ncbi:MULTISPECIES: hypothetical protein [Streptomyces]|uniref:Uncharacterized protein n=1 Tax=Streptomyces nanshensis TaxID=518642 RepID=A0A1E7L6Y0_9ACTN|nr:MULTISPECIES: hypothetical protein [Streptomyces]OEV11956.1 hypothetical protein AN218_10515 [Streptomyces nanshensis]
MTGVSMRALLASRAAAEAVSTPPSEPSDVNGPAADGSSGAEPGDEARTSRDASGPRSQPGQDAA